MRTNKMPLEAIRKAIGFRWMNKDEWNRLSSSEIRRFVKHELKGLRNGIKEHEKYIEELEKDITRCQSNLEKWIEQMNVVNDLLEKYE